MLFRRKKEGEGSRAELRRHYRHAPGKKHALSVKLARPEDPVAGDLIDLSAGGAGVLFPWDRDPGMVPGDEVVLSFTSLVHGGEVETTARVARARDEQEPAGRRYGFEFTDHERLFAQLDAYYFKFFNRRRAMRVRPGLDRELCAELSFGPESVKVALHDVSPDGFGVLMKAEEAQLLDGVASMTCTFTLPGSDDPITWQARAVHRTALAQGRSLGAVFLLSEADAVGPQRVALADYCAARAAELAQWSTPSESA